MGILMLINITFLTPPVMVDNLAEKLNEWPLNWCHYVYDLECEMCPLYGVVGCQLFRGF